jgi:hypothetical protein
MMSEGSHRQDGVFRFSQILPGEIEKSVWAKTVSHHTLADLQLCSQSGSSGVGAGWRQPCANEQLPENDGEQRQTGIHTLLAFLLLVTVSLHLGRAWPRGL